MRGGGHEYRHCEEIGPRSGPMRRSNPSFAALRESQMGCFVAKALLAMTEVIEIQTIVSGLLKH
jgi:hypothetical protein